MICHIADTLARVFAVTLAGVLERAGYAVTVERLSILDRLAGLPAETPADRAIREQGERLREAFPHVVFDDPGNHCALRLFRYRRSLPLTTISTRRLPHWPQTSRDFQSSTLISAP
jgi:hypothetical protein